MLIIYTVPVSLYCAKLRILLRHKSLDWEEQLPAGGYGSNQYKRTVPSGNLPAMLDGDILLTDSEAIAEYLNEKYPEPPMLPNDLMRRALSRERSRFHDTRLEPELRALFPYIPPAGRDAAFITAQAEKLNMRLAQLATMLERHAPKQDDRLTLGDCGMPITCTWIDALAGLFGMPIQWPEKVIAERQRVSQYDAVSQELADYQPILATYLGQNR